MYFNGVKPFYLRGNDCEGGDVEKETPARTDLKKPRIRAQSTFGLPIESDNKDQGIDPDIDLDEDF